jgi:hypothetical protein
MVDDPFPGVPIGDGYYIIDEKDLKDAIIMRPGIPDFDCPDSEIVSSEQITPTTSLKPVDVIIFNDKYSPYPTDESGCNQWAFVVDDKRALYVRRVVRGIKLKDAHKLKNAIVIRRFPEALAPFLAPMLLRYRWRPSMFQVAINHLQMNQFLPFINGSFFPPDVTYTCNEEYDEAWRAMTSLLEPRDAIFTFDRNSIVSKIIAVTTHGPFSHCAVYAGNGVISEVVTSGTRMVPIETYKGRHYRVAAYRHYGKSPNTIEEMLQEMKATDGQTGYDYLGALKAGVKALFGRHQDAYTPNSHILSGYLTFIAQA